MSSVTHRIFVYGTLRSGSKNKFFTYLNENARHIGQGKLNARLYDLGEYPGAIASKSKSEVTVGEVYEITDNKWGEIIKRLDEYEGYDSGDITGSEYIRRKTKVKMGSKNVDAWIYWYNLPLKGKKQITAGDYVLYSDK